MSPCEIQGGRENNTKMKTFTRPKIFRSTVGCCICKAKSSSSRFTDSEKYEEDFAACFQLSEEERRGEICNACVLVVKRWRKLPRRSMKNWSHVVDSKSGTGAVAYNNKGSVKKRRQDPGTPSEEKLLKIRRKFRRRPKSSRQLVFCKINKESIVAVGSKVRNRKMSKPKRLCPSSVKEQISETFSSQYWIKRSGCCGSVFCGRGGERVLSVNQFRGCSKLVETEENIPSFVETELKMLKDRKKEEFDEGFCDKNSISTNPSSPDSIKTINDDI